MKDRNGVEITVGARAFYFGIEVLILRYEPSALGRYSVRFPTGGTDYAFPDDLLCRPSDVAVLPAAAAEGGAK